MKHVFRLLGGGRWRSSSSPIGVGEILLIPASPERRFDRGIREAFTLPYSICSF